MHPAAPDRLCGSRSEHRWSGEDQDVRARAAVGEKMQNAYIQAVKDLTNFLQRSPDCRACDPLLPRGRAAAVGCGTGPGRNAGRLCGCIETAARASTPGLDGPGAGNTAVSAT